MLQIRIGWLAYAMRLMLKCPNTKSLYDGYKDIHDLSPSKVKQLLLDVLTANKRNDLSWLQKKQIVGALNKVIS